MRFNSGNKAIKLITLVINGVRDVSQKVKYLTGMQEALHHMDEPAVPGLGKWRQKDQKFNIIVYYIGSSRPGWAA